MTTDLLFPAVIVGIAGMALWELTKIRQRLDAIHKTLISQNKMPIYSSREDERP